MVADPLLSLIEVVAEQGQENGRQSSESRCDCVGHQNFPGQFRQLAPHLESRGHDLVAICSHQRPIALKGRVLRYSEPEKASGVPLGTQLWHDGLQRSAAVAKLAQSLAAEGWKPDQILGHSGWGETLGLSAIWPDVPQIIWPELWIRPEHGGYGIDPLKPRITLESQLEQLGRNAMTRAALADATAWVMPTEHQATVAKEFRDKRLHVIHEGIDTQLAQPNPAVKSLRGMSDRSVPRSRSLTATGALRGFDVFMRAPTILASQDVRVLIVGDNEAGYGGEGGSILFESVLKGLRRLDLNRVIFSAGSPIPS